MRLLYLLVLSLCFLPSLVSADTVWLDNGDQLSGKILLIDGGKLLLKTSYAGTITIDSKNITSIKSEQEFNIREQRFATLYPSTIEPAQQQVQVQQEQQTKIIAVQNIHQAIPVRKPTLTAQDFLWSGNIHAAADFKRKESSSDSYDLDVKNSLRHGLWRHHIDAQGSYEIKDKKKKTDKHSLSYALDHFLTPKWFWQGKAKYSHDGIEDLRKQYMLGTGPGYQFWDDELSSFSTTGLLTGSKYRFKNGGKEEFSAGAFSWDYKRFWFSKRLELFNNGEVSLPFTQEIDFALDAETGLRFHINGWASLSMKAQWEKVKSKSGDLNDRRYLLGAGVNW